MKLLKFLPLCSVAVFAAANIYAQNIGQETAFGRQLNTRDDQPLREFVQSKENIELKDKSKNMEISGDVRFEWRSIQEKGVVFFKDCGNEGSSKKSSGSSSSHSSYSQPSYSLYSPSSSSSSSSSFPSSHPSFKENYRYLRGGNHVDARGIPISTNDFDVEFNFKLKYTYKDSWAFAHLQFDNPAGIRGTNDCYSDYVIFNKKGSKIERVNQERDRRFNLKGSGLGLLFTLKRAFIGYNMFADGKQRLDMEIGRQKLDDIFESEIQFSNRFDGVLFRYAHSVEDIFDWYLTGGGFVIDENVNHFGYAIELGLIDIYETGFDLRYSFIDWTKRGRNRCFVNPLGSLFQNSQISFAYTISQSIFSREIPFEFYGGFLVNHAAKKSVFTHRKRKNLGWYAGVYIGNVDKKGDWSFDIEYIGIQAQAVPDDDVSSIGRGNFFDERLVDIVNETFYGSKRDSCPNFSSRKPSSDIKGVFPRRGNANFVGWRFEFLYAITDNFSIDTIFEFSNEEDRHIGGRHRYHDFEIEAVYAF